MKELKPCPFCGSETEVCEGGINGKMRVYGLVEHKDGCFFLADGLSVKYQHIMESEFAAWNTRAERTCTNELQPDEYKRNFFKCSACGCIVTDAEDYHVNVWAPGGGHEWKYCPNCGARVCE